MVPQVKGLKMTTAHIIETDATPEEVAELAERLRVEYPECTITLRTSDAFACPSWCTLEQNHGDWGTYEESDSPCAATRVRRSGSSLWGRDGPWTA